MLSRWFGVEVGTQAQTLKVPVTRVKPVLGSPHICSGTGHHRYNLCTIAGRTLATCAPGTGLAPPFGASCALRAHICPKPPRVIASCGCPCLHDDCA